VQVDLENNPLMKFRTTPYPYAQHDPSPLEWIVVTLYL
jgi:hypothetical protein